MSKVITSENVNAFVELIKTQNKLAKYTRVSHVRDQLIVVEHQHIMIKKWILYMSNIYYKNTLYSQVFLVVKI